MAADIVNNLDLAAITERASERAGAPLLDVRLLTGGMSSITVFARLRRPDGPVVVLKLAPPGLEPVRNRDVLRQARLLRALAQVEGVAVPEMLFTDDGDPPFFGMAFVEGDSFEPVSGDEPLPPPSDLSGRGLAAATMLAVVHSVDPGAIGVGDEPVIGISAEVDRWVQALATVDDDLRGDYLACAQALRDQLPAAVKPAILHGDWRLGNMLCREDRIEAVIDWEIWSVGDPRVDLAWFLANTVYEGNRFATRPAPGLPDRAALLDAYHSAGGGPVADLEWFGALVKFKSAATMGLILKRNRRAARPDPTVEANAPRLPALVRDALASLRGHKG